MSEKIIVSLQMCVSEKETIRLAADKEMRSLSNFLLLAALERARDKHGLSPQYENGDGPEKGE